MLGTSTVHPRAFKVLEVLNQTTVGDDSGEYACCRMMALEGYKLLQIPVTHEIHLQRPAGVPSKYTRKSNTCFNSLYHYTCTVISYWPCCAQMSRYLISPTITTAAVCQQTNLGTEKAFV